MTKSGEVQSGSPTNLNGPGILFLALAAAVATSTSYTVQPELSRIAHDLGTTLVLASGAAGLSILGYMFGLALLVPLVDRLPAHRLVPVQLGILALGLIVASVAPNVYVFGLGLLISGVCASAGAQMSTLAGKHAPAERRGRALGTVTAGISAGVLFGRIVGGGLADGIGWRAMLGVVACLCLACALVGFVVLPRDVMRSQETYLSTLRSMPQLLKIHSTLRIAALSGALWFFAFSLIWVSLSLALALPPLSLSASLIGLYSLAGLAGIVATRVAGQMADKFGSRKVVLVGLSLAFVCALIMAPSLSVAPLILVTLALFDAGLFAAQVASQRLVLTIDPSRPARFNSAYMVVYFIGGSAGTAVGGLIISLAGWPTAAGAAALAIATAFAIVCFMAKGRVALHLSA